MAASKCWVNPGTFHARIVKSQPYNIEIIVKNGYHRFFFGLKYFAMLYQTLAQCGLNDLSSKNPSVTVIYKCGHTL